jgi:hypothetical protein
MLVDVTRRLGNGLVTAASCAVLIGVFILFSSYEKSKYDQLREECIALGGTFNPGDRLVILKNGTGKPPVCTY